MQVSTTSQLDATVMAIICQGMEAGNQNADASLSRLIGNQM